jgi:hypothetical protein
MEDNINVALVNKYKQHGGGINDKELEISPCDVPGDGVIRED